jgi:TetR/AcrR family transcriptional repressor of nem operon
MTRTKEYDRDEVLDAATQVFWDKGFKGTSVSDLVTATGLGKRSMYQEFGSKDSLFRECIDNYALRTNREINVILTQQPLGLQNIEAFFHNRIDYASSNECRGCMIVNSTIEKKLIKEEAFGQVQKYLSHYEEVFFQCLKAAQANGEIDPENDCRALSGYLSTFVAGMMVKSKTNPNKESLEELVELVLSTIKR